MTIDFGSVQKYNAERGFGFVKRTLRDKQSTREIFFHIKTIKHEYHELAQKLDSGSYDDVSFWYEVEKTGKGEQVSKLWLSAEDIPSKELDSLTAKIQGLWHDIDAPTPHWLNQITLLLVGQICTDDLIHKRERLQRQRKEAEEEERKKRKAERLKRLEAIREKERLEAERRRKKEAERLKYLKYLQEKERSEAEQRRKHEAERKAQILAAQEAERIAAEQQRQTRLQLRASEIQKICQMYGIEVLVHFTHIANLNSILQHGLIGRSQLESMSWVEPPKYNDIHRLDGQREAICLSISFPNYKMFYKYSFNNRSDWVVLLLKPSILWEQDCKFYQENAASNNAKENIAQRTTQAKKQPEALIQMFSDYERVKRETLDIPNNFTTHPQAEVLVFNQISTQYIDVVHFHSLDVRKQWANLNPGNYSQTFYAGYRDYFSPRQDWQMW